MSQYKKQNRISTGKPLESFKKDSGGFFAVPEQCKEENDTIFSVRAGKICRIPLTKSDKNGMIYPTVR